MNNIQSYEIHTERLFLRPIQKKDVPHIFEITHSHPDMVKFMTFNPPQRIEETMKFFEETQIHTKKEKLVRWGIFLQERLVGIISLEDITRNIRACRMDVAEMGYWLNPEFHGQGIMTEVGKAVLEFGFNQLNLHKVKISHISENIASQRVIEKLGFRFVGEKKEDVFRFEKWWNKKIYEIIIDEFYTLYP